MKILLSAVIVLFLLGGCGTEPKKQIRTFDIPAEEAACLIDEAEYWYAWLCSQDTISRADADRLMKKLDTVPSAYPAQSLISALLDDRSQWNDPSVTELKLDERQHIPSLYHRTVAIESAAVTEETWTENGEERYHAELKITLVHTGRTTGYLDWTRTYRYSRESPEAPWEFSKTGGFLTVRSYAELPLTDAFDAAPYTFD